MVFVVVVVQVVEQVEDFDVVLDVYLVGIVQEGGVVGYWQVGGVCVFVVLCQLFVNVLQWLVQECVFEQVYCVVGDWVVYQVLEIQYRGVVVDWYQVVWYVIVMGYQLGLVQCVVYQVVMYLLQVFDFVVVQFQVQVVLQELFVEQVGIVLQQCFVELVEVGWYLDCLQVQQLFD